MRKVRILFLSSSLLLFAAHSGHLLAQGHIRKVEVHARRFEFVPAEITLKKGETVEVTLISEDVAHSLLIRELGINKVVTKTHPAEIVITPTAAGDYHGQCGRFCGSGHGKMIFTVHVTEN
jgi:cytochrome c oxidase subunit 2